MSKLTFTPTQEQLDIVEASKTAKVLKVNALAGASKTTTLALIAEQNVEPSLYLAFNKAIADEAKDRFPDHVTCRTTHSMAYATFGAKLKVKLSRDRGEKYVNVAGTPSEIVKYYSIPSLLKNDGVLEARSIATMVKATVGSFQNSADLEIGKHHIPQYELKELLNHHCDITEDELVTKVLYYAVRLWKDRIDTDSVVLAEHDTYLKLWQLSNPVLDYKILYIDEAQDSNALVLDIISKQKDCRVIYVGDQYQSIYAWRGAVNAMEKIKAPTLTLTKSFRFGQPVADVANFILRNEVNMKGFEKLESKEGYVTSNTYTKIFRTNGALLAEMLELVPKGRRVKALVDTRNFESLLRSAYALKRGDHAKVKHESVTLYSTWEELVEEAQDDVELKRIVMIICGGKTFEYLDVIAKMRYAPKEYDILLTTAHKSKGLEWDDVIIADDFDSKYFIAPKDSPDFNQQELNLLYVACTRAKKNLELPQWLREIRNGEFDYDVFDLDFEEV